MNKVCPPAPRRGLAARKLLALLALAALALALLYYLARPAGEDALGVAVEDSPRTEVRRGDLTITILQSGELQAKRSVDINNETGSNAKIVYIVEDGARVEPGDLLVELDSEQMQDQLLTERSNLANAEADLQRAREDLEIQDIKYKSDLESAELKVELRRLDLERYEQAEYPQQLRNAEMGIMLAEEELKRAEQKIESVTKLVEKGFTSRRELESAELELKRKEVALEEKREDQRILKDYTYYKELKQKQNDLRDQIANVERMKKTYESERQSALASLESKRTSLEVRRNRLKRIEDQLEETKIHADFSGLVFHDKGNRWNPVNFEVGTQVSPRQKILEFPDLSVWEIKLQVPESIIERLEPGQQAWATVDAVEGVVLEAEVLSVGIAPEDSRWFDPSGKRYPVILDIPTTPSASLKPGLSVMAEVLIDELRDVLYAPIQAVTARGGEQYVYRVQGGRAEPVLVETGGNNENYVEIVSGLEEGEELLLYAPVEAEIQRRESRRPMSRIERGDEEGTAAE